MPRYEDDERDDYEDRRPNPTFPMTVRIAGIIWLLMGLLILTSTILTIVFNVIQDKAVNQNNDANPTSGYITMGVGFIFGLIFLMVGVQTARGTAKDTLGNSIGSLIFALLYGTCGILVFVGARFAPVDKQLQTIMIIASVINTLSGFGLLVAGVLGLVGRSQYKAWRKAQEKPRRRQEREDYDD